MHGRHQHQPPGAPAAQAREAAGGKRRFDGFQETVTLEHLRVRQSPFATHVTYRVVR